MALTLSVRIETWPIAGASRSRAARVPRRSWSWPNCRTVRAPVAAKAYHIARYRETADSVAAALEAMRDELGRGLDRSALQQVMPAGAARNALDCAFWDLEAKRTGKTVHELAGLAPPQRADHRLHALPRHAGGDGGCGGAGAPIDRS